MAVRLVMEVHEEQLGFWTCFFMRSSIHVIFRPESGDLKGHEFKCAAVGGYILGSQEIGQKFVLMCAILTLILGVVGLVTNVINVFVLRQTIKGTNFRELLVSLALVDILMVLATIGFIVSAQLITDNVDTGYLTTFVLVYGCQLFNVSRTCSSSITILITVERYLYLGFPKNYKFLYKQSWKSRMCLACVVLFSIVINFPWLLNSGIERNEFYLSTSTLPPVGTGNPETGGQWTEAAAKEFANFKYYHKPTDAAKLIGNNLREALLAINFLLPLPSLLVFNSLLYRAVRAWGKRRESRGRHRRNQTISATKMIFVVGFTQFWVHLVSVIYFVSQIHQKVAYIDMYFLQGLASVVSASSHFFIYCFSIQNFRIKSIGLLRHF